MTLPSGKAAGCGLAEATCALGVGRGGLEAQSSGWTGFWCVPRWSWCMWLPVFCGGRQTNAPQHHAGCFSACLGNMQTNVAVSLCGSRSWSIRPASKSRERSLGDVQPLGALKVKTKSKPFLIFLFCFPPYSF